LQVEEFLEQSARQFPEKTALVCGDQRLTYREIEEQCNRLAHALIALGIERGDRIAVYLDNSVGAVAAIFAALKAGAVFLVLNPTTKAEKLAYILNNCRAKALITHAKKFAVLKDGLPQMPHLQNIIVGGAIVETLENGTKRFSLLAELLTQQMQSVQPPPRGASTSTWRLSSIRRVPPATQRAS
jgi:long-chain acyl-CoA synthetase